MSGRIIKGKNIFKIPVLSCLVIAIILVLFLVLLRLKEDDKSNTDGLVMAGEKAVENVWILCKSTNDTEALLLLTPYQANITGPY